MNLKLKDDLISRLKTHHQETSFKTLEELIEYILEKYLSEISSQNNKAESSVPEELNQRLKDLGYL